jgi:hypothetical protein
MDRIGADVQHELARFGPAMGMAEIVAAWPGAVGEGIATNAWPARLARDGTLHVASSSSAWAFELTHLANEVLARLREHLGESTPPRLRFEVGPLPERHAEIDVKGKRTVPTVDAAARAEGERIAASIADSELRELVARAAAASLVRSLDDRSF